jgi:probable rRNA maturation factor
MPFPGDSASLSSQPVEAPEPEPPSRLRLSIVREDGDWRSFGTPEPAIETAAAALARQPRSGLARDGEASIVLGSDALVQRLNRSYRSKDAPTNVLSFPYQRPPGAADDGYLGDVVLAVETVLREAAERGIEPAQHLQHLVVHGLLHLLGHDHGTDAEAEAMERLETEILATLGIADPYAACAS